MLRREAGIVSADYLTDLARIFMSIDTHVFADVSRARHSRKSVLVMHDLLAFPRRNSWDMHYIREIPH